MRYGMRMRGAMMLPQPMSQTTESGAVDSRWKGLYKVGGVAAPVIAVLLVCEIVVFSVWPQLQHRGRLLHAVS